MTTSHDQQLKNTRYRNWVKAGLGLKYLGHGLAPSVNDAVKRQHEEILQDIAKNIGACSSCGLCNLETLLPNHTSHQGKTCPLGYKACNCRSPRGKTICPTKLCSEIYEKLTIQHRYLSPNWHNTDIGQWFDNHWQIGKVFIPAGGYKNTDAASETDCAGLLNIVINNTKMYSLFDTVIDAPNDVFSKTRKARDNIFHSSSLELTDAELQNILDNMEAILEDEKHLKNTTAASEARKNIEQLRNQNFVITMYDEENIRKSAMNAINELHQRVLESISEKQRQVIDAVQESGLEQRAEVSMIETRLEKDEQAVKELQRKQIEIEQIVCKNQQQLQQQIQQLQLDIHAINQELTRITSDELYSKTRASHEDVVKYIDEKKALQNDLILHYGRYYCVLSVHPLMKEKELKVDETFVKPRMRRLKPKKLTQGQEGSNITSYRDIFWSEDIRHRNIYITGEAGIGKSAFCTKIISEWCQVHDVNKKYVSDVSETSMSEEIALEMKPFEFLFFISLRHCKEENSLEEMIKNQLLPTRRYKDLFERLMEEDSDKCLVIIDGLDEWKANREDAIPRRNLMAKFSIITTTRPWVLEKYRLRDSEIDTNIELCGVDSSSAKNFVEKMITYLNTSFNRCRSFKDFEKELLLKDLTELGRIPILLQQMVCVWHDEQTLGKSQCDVYSSMINLLIQIAEQNGKFESTLPCSDSGLLPSCFGDKRKCVAHENLILSLGKLAFHTLFTGQFEQQLVFPSTQIEICGISALQLDQFLAIGIVTQSEAGGISAVSRYKTLAFIHKSFQEFFAALYIAVHTENKLPTKLSKSIFDCIYRCCKSFHDVLSYSLVFKYLCGMGPTVGRKISMHVQNVIVKERDRADKLSLSSMYSKSVYGTTCGRLISEGNEVIQRMNALFLDWIHEGKRCGHEDIQLICSEITDLELYKNIDQQYVQALSFYWTDLSSSQPVHHNGPLKGLHISDSSSFSAMNEPVIELIRRSKQTLTEVHLDLFGLPQSEDGENILTSLFSTLSQTCRLQYVGLTNMEFSSKHIKEAFVWQISKLELLKTIYLENITQEGSKSIFPQIGIDFSNMKHLVHIHVLNCDVAFYIIPHQVRVVCLDAYSMKNTFKYLLELKQLQVLSFLPLLSDEPYMSSNFYDDDDVISSVIQALPEFECLKHLQISSVDFRGYNLKLSRNLNLLSTVVLSNILIEEGRLLKFLQNMPCSVDIVRNRQDSLCMNDLFIRRFKMVFKDEQDVSRRCHGLEILSDETREFVQQMIDNKSLVVLEVMKPYKKQIKGRKD